MIVLMEDSANPNRYNSKNMTRKISMILLLAVAVAGAVELPRQVVNPAAISTAVSLWNFSAAEEAAAQALVDCYGDSLLREDVDGEIRCKFESRWPTAKLLRIPLNPTLAKPMWGMVVHDLRSLDGISAQTCISPVDAEMPSGQQVDGHTAPWVGTTPWYQPTANEDIAPPAHQMPSGHIRHVLKLILLY